MPASARPPGPRGRWFIGNLQAYEQDRLGFLMRSREAHGGVVSLGRHTTVIHDPDTAVAVLGSEDFVIGDDFLQRRLSPNERVCCTIR
ncbi:hypothetical protein [Marmoricola sp. RAF53]|uniref:hypothetical protein n=1 Tax=Marmoricola sp. RAF53 TaxID=3233059 RepID=UPI003F94E57C